MEMKRSIHPFFGALAFVGLMTTGVGISTADTIQTEGNYPTRQACQDAGAGVKASTFSATDGAVQYVGYV